MAAAPLIVWRFTDGRRGHDAQSLGLVKALGELRRCRVHDIAVPSRGRALIDLIRGRFPDGDGLPDPDLLIGAGHATHAPLLAARRARGGRAVVLMSPSLPTRCFDLCLIPEHDAPRAAPQVIATRGPLNPITPGGGPRTGPGVILLGGPSRHYRWDPEALLRSVQSVLASPAARWLIGDSPRTPPGMRAALRALASRNAEYAAWESCRPGWLAEQLRIAPAAWISCDSLSMIYEALTAGAPVGVFGLEARRHSRVSGAIARLVEQGWVTPHAAWRAGTTPGRPAGEFREASRCAELLLRHFGIPSGAA